MGRLEGLGVGDEGNTALSGAGAHRRIIEIEVRWVDTDQAQQAALAAMAPQACNDGVNAGEHGSARERVLAEEHG